ncbi:hypothetical protein IMZ48_35440 [Candidatus Bathyarchaeota archaeon]|nr:hypothetical protein [Candidatus Bathyarchaeota archaeon]
MSFGTRCGPGPPTEAYETLEEASSAIRSHAFANGYALIVHYSHPDCERPTRVTYKCAKSGYPPKKDANHDTHRTKRRKASSQRVNCHYRVNLKLRRGLWHCEAVKHDQRRPAHNHDWAEASSFSSWRLEQLRPHEADVIAMWNSGGRPMQIARWLWQKEAPYEAPDVTPKDVSNLILRQRDVELAGERPIQWLLKVRSLLCLPCCLSTLLTISPYSN